MVEEWEIKMVEIKMVEEWEILLRFFIGWLESEEEWIWTFEPFSNLKTTFCKYWTSIKIKISMTVNGTGAMATTMFIIFWDIGGSNYRESTVILTFK